MGSVYSTQIFAGTVAASTLTTVVPVSTLVQVVVDIEMITETGTAVCNLIDVLHNVYIISVIAPGLTSGVAWKQWTGRVVIPPGDSVHAYASASCSLCISGYVLTP